MLSESAALFMQTNRPVPIESRALGTLSYIRASIDAASSLAVPGLAGIVMGAIGAAARRRDHVRFPDRRDTTRQARHRPAWRNRGTRR